MKSHVSAILLCGGKGMRMGGNLPKQYLPLGGKPIAQYSFEVFAKHPRVAEVIVVCEPEFRSFFSRSSNTSVIFTSPGERRQDSVYHGLQKVSSNCGLVAIHDSARPFVSEEMLDRVCNAAEVYGAATVGVPIKFTAKESCPKGFVAKTLERETIWEIQTPQVLKQEILKKGFEKALNDHAVVTDDVSLAELIGHPVKIIEGSSYNLKITTPEDLSIATSFLASILEKKHEL